MLSIAFVESIIQRSSHSCQCDWFGRAAAQDVENAFTGEFRANAKLFLKKKGRIFFTVTSLCQRYRQTATMNTRKQKWRDKLVRKREGKEGEKKVKSRCVRWQNAKAHTRDYPPNEEEYPSQLGVWGPPTSQLASAHIF